jgi:hypothetical protein
VGEVLGVSLESWNRVARANLTVGHDRPLPRLEQFKQRYSRNEGGMGEQLSAKALRRKDAQEAPKA